MKSALVAGLGFVFLSGSAMAGSKYEYKPSPPAKSYSAPAKSYSPPARQQEYKRQDKQNDYRRQDNYRASQNRVVTDQLKKKQQEDARKRTYGK